LDPARRRCGLFHPLKEIKGSLPGLFDQIGPGEIRNESRVNRGEAAIWQRRFWEHTIRDEEDLNRHRDYIHYNPVKHRLVQRVSTWPWSSFHRYVKMGYYQSGWGEDVGNDVIGLACGE
jgi:putative transposase